MNDGDGMGDTVVSTIVDGDDIDAWVGGQTDGCG